MNFRDLRPYVCAVLDGAGALRGTAFFFRSDGWLLTCAHVVESCGGAVSLKVFGRERPLPCRVESIHTRLDAALLRAADEKWPSLMLGSDWKLAQRVVSHGFSRDYATTTFADGYPLVETRICSLVTVGDRRGHADAIALEGSPVNQGLSGGPAINIDTGEVIGILRWRQDDRRCLATPIPSLLADWSELRVVAPSAPNRADWGHLPYCVDREPQTPVIIDAVARVFARGSRRPIFCVLHGPDAECPDSFLEILREDLIPEIEVARGTFRWHRAYLPPPRSPASSLTWTSLSWPRQGATRTTAQLIADLVAELRDLVPGADVPARPTPIELRDHLLAKIGRPLLLRTALDAGSWTRSDCDLLCQWADYWRTFPDLPDGQLLVVFAMIYHRAMRPRTGLAALFRRRATSPAKRCIEDLASRYDLVLPELGPVEQFHAEEWARANDKHGRWRVVLQRVLDDIAAAYFAGPQDAGPQERVANLSMRAVSGRLIRVLDQHARYAARGGSG